MFEIMDEKQIDLEHYWQGDWLFCAANTSSTVQSRGIL